jgi:hypothetical protein
MHTVNLISAAIANHEDRPTLPCKPIYGTCAITGIDGACVPREKLFGKSFTNSDLLAHPDSNMVSVDAYYALKFKWERKNSWFTDGNTFERLTRKDVRTKVFQDSMPPQWSAYATTSYKKHGALNTKINTAHQRIWLFEMRQVDCSDMAVVSEWWGILNVALQAGIWKSIMGSLECPPFVMSKIGLKNWLRFESWARPKYLSALYSFLRYLLPSKEELKHELSKPSL